MAKKNGKKGKAKAHATKMEEARPDAIEGTPQGDASPRGGAVAAPRLRDPRLPAPGTVLQKKDRTGNVRCECTVEEEGIRYADKTYRSLSAAAMAAAKDLGLHGKTANGFSFFGLSKPVGRARNPIEGIEKAWARYQAKAAGIVTTAVTEEARVPLREVLAKHAGELAELAKGL